MSLVVVVGLATTQIYTHGHYLSLPDALPIILRLIPRAAGRVVDGEIRFEGRDLLALTPRELESVRGRDISMIFQEPMTSLNPVLRIGDQVAETLQLHKGMGRRAARARPVEPPQLARIELGRAHVPTPV